MIDIKFLFNSSYELTLSDCTKSSPMPGTARRTENTNLQLCCKSCLEAPKVISVMKPAVSIIDSYSFRIRVDVRNTAKPECSLDSYHLTEQLKRKIWGSKAVAN